ncbi:sensor histidine kinase KdpD [Roseomonas sp. AR75]|uniref:sensor histidine kinase n=1 Tax=Roseomonas sp. AR75 TaxID=2562311 RepID=UPI001485854B|nr:ATP-binding protein [Roseomonas sp. AR75]
MEMNAMSLAAIAVAMMAILAALHLLRDRTAWREKAGQAEQLAATRARSMSLAAQEMRGIAAAMGGLGRVDPCRAMSWLPADGPAQQILRLADDLAEIAAGAPQHAIHAAPAPLGPMVDAALTTVSAQIRPGIRHWQVDPALRRLVVNADRRALQGALTALLRRAASHSRDGDVVALHWVVASETVSIVVEDEGDGLAAMDLLPESPFAPAGTRGLDLGLSLARSLAAAHGGDIRLESAPGIGARAWLTLPRDRLLEAA